VHRILRIGGLEGAYEGHGFQCLLPLLLLLII
jgi:hypothetical protein